MRVIAASADVFSSVIDGDFTNHQQTALCRGGPRPLRLDADSSSRVSLQQIAIFDPLHTITFNYTLESDFPARILVKIDWQ